MLNSAFDICDSLVHQCQHHLFQNFAFSSLCSPQSPPRLLLRIPPILKLLLDIRRRKRTPLKSLLDDFQERSPANLHIILLINIEWTRPRPGSHRADLITAILSIFLLFAFVARFAGELTASSTVTSAPGRRAQIAHRELAHDVSELAANCEASSFARIWIVECDWGAISWGVVWYQEVFGGRFS